MTCANPHMRQNTKNEENKTKIFALMCVVLHPSRLGPHTSCEQSQTKKITLGKLLYSLYLICNTIKAHRTK